ncbi:MAG: restriction endonuclease subunit S [Longimicrobiaceae bacterium]
MTTSAVEASNVQRAAGLRRFKPYPAYKDSGVEWLGEIPAGWEVLPAGRLIERIEQGWSPVAEDRVAGPDEWAVIKLSAVSHGEFRGHEHKALPESVAPDRRYEIYDGDFLLTRANTPQLVGDVCVARGVRPRLMLCDLVYRLRLDRRLVWPEFLSYWFLSASGRHQIEVDARGSSQSMVKVSQGHIRTWRVVAPPAPEQRAIAAFLDRETARIDALVAKKERLIALLQEKRTALITRAITKGLAPNVPMKDSGVEWLGEIPDHWEVTRVKNTASKIGSGKTPSGGAEVYVSAGVMLLRSQNVHFGGLRLDEVAFIEPKTDAEMSGSRVRDGDVLLNITGASIGRCCVAHLDERSANVNQHVCIIRPKPDGFDPAFLAAMLASHAGQTQIFTTENGISRDALNFGQIGDLALALPPLHEQRAIAAFLDREAVKINALLSKVRDAIDRLKELRTALISAAVTGKIDVREEVTI